MSALLPPPAGMAGKAWSGAALVGTALLGFFVPFSTAGISLASALLLLLVLLRPRQLWALQPWREPVFAVGLALLAWIALHTAWVTGLGAEGRTTINRYHELLLAPLLFAALLDARRQRAFFIAFTAGLVLLAVGYWVVAFAPQLPLARGMAARRISAGFGLALGALLLLLHAQGATRPWPLRAVAAFLAATVVFAMDGRTGHVLIAILGGYATWTLAPRRWRLALAVAAPLAVLAVALVGSNAFKSRLQETMQSQHAITAPPQTSTEIRVAFARMALDLAGRYGLAGAGYANYSAVHEAAARERYGRDPATAAYLEGEWVRTPNPHNEYAMQLVGGGVAGLGLFLAWLLSTCLRARGLATTAATRRTASMLTGAVLAFAVGSLFNSLLMDFVEAHLYVSVLAALLASAHLHRGDTAPDRILVVATRQIGDVLLTTPLVRAARERWPAARIDVLGFQGTLGMLAGNPDIHDGIETPARLGWSGTLALLRRLRRRYDLALITDAGDRAHLIGWLAARRRTGVLPEAGGSNWWKRLLLQHAVTASGDRGTVHVVAEKLALLGPEDATRAPRAVVPPPGTPLPAALDAALAPGAVVVHAPSMWAYKQWPLDHFAAVVRQLLAEGRQVVLTGSASARDQECIAPLRALGAAPRLLDASGQLDFSQLVTLFGRATLYIGPDTSVSHLAAASGIPVLAVFGPTNPMRWAPWPHSPVQGPGWQRAAGVQRLGNVTLVQSGLPCVPCGRAGCEDHRNSRSDCLDAIAPERVLEQAHLLLQGH
jgi:heptosyltransferase-3